MKFFLSLVSLFTSLFAGAYQEVEDTFSLSPLSLYLKERKTAKIILENGLQVYLISDPKAVQSSLALTVEVGSFSDPEEALGIAHFMEHMIFQGTKSHPENNSLTRFISDHGGDFNAYTEGNHTAYFFSIQNALFEETLSRLAEHFREPLFTKEALGKEVHAVHEEFLRAQESDEFRFFQVIKETSPKNHPFSHFSCGTLDSLKGVDSTYMHTFFKDHYSPKWMHLTVYSPLPLSDLKEKVSSSFSTIRSPLLRKKEFSKSCSEKKYTNTITYIEPLKNLKWLRLEWEVPESFLEDPTKPFTLIAHTFNYIHEKSLAEDLKREALAEGCYARISKKTSSRAIFSIHVDLTEKGVKNHFLVVEKIFQVLKTFQKRPLPFYLWEEKEHLAKLSYQYQERKAKAIVAVLEHASSILEGPFSSYPEDVIFSQKPSEKKLSEALAFLSPDNFRIYLMASSLPCLLDQKEVWSKASFAVKKIPSAQLESWKKGKEHPRVEVPGRNLFAPTDFTLLPTESVDPSLLFENEYGRLYHKGDTLYKSPKIAFSFRVLSAAITPSAKSEVLLDFFLSALIKRLEIPLDAARKAGLNVSFEAKNLQLYISLSGFSEKAPLLTEKIFRECKNTSLTQEEFLVNRETLFDLYVNEEKETALDQGFHFLDNSFSRDSFSPEEKRAVLQKLSYEEVSAFQDILFKKAYIEAFLLGNISQKQAESLWLDVHHIIKNEAFPLKYHTPLTTVSLKEGPCFLEKPVALPGNATLLVIEAEKNSAEQQAAFAVLGTILQESFFHALRTEQKTAYTVSAVKKNWGQNLYQVLAVQSGSHEPLDLLFRFELFLENFLGNFLIQVPEERFLNNKKAALHKLENPHKNLHEEGALYAKLAFSYEGDFLLLGKIKEALEKLTYSDFQAFCQALLGKNNTKRFALLVKGKSPFTYKPLIFKDFDRITQIEKHCFEAKKD